MPKIIIIIIIIPPSVSNIFLSRWKPALICVQTTRQSTMYLYIIIQYGIANKLINLNLKKVIVIIIFRGEVNNL